MNVEFKELEEGLTLIPLRDYDKLFEANRDMRQKLSILEELFREEVRLAYEVAECRFASDNNAVIDSNPFNAAGINLKKIASLIGQSIYYENFYNRAEELRTQYLKDKKVSSTDQSNYPQKY